MLNLKKLKMKKNNQMFDYEEDEWCNYAGMPSPKAYDKSGKEMWAQKTRKKTKVKKFKYKNL